MTWIILVPLFVIGFVVIMSRVAKWVGQGVEAAIGVGVGLCAVFAVFVIVAYSARHFTGGTSAKAPTPITTATSRPVTSAPGPTVTTRSTSSPTPIPSPRETIPASVPTTTPPDPASRGGFGSLWMNVCGSSSKGYRMCKGSKPTAEQIATCFPADVCAPPTTDPRSRAIPA